MSAAAEERSPARPSGAAPAGRWRRHRRLLLLCGLSALAHLAVLQLMTRAGPGKSALPAGRVAADDLVLRLAPAAAPRPRSSDTVAAVQAAAPAPPQPAPLASLQSSSNPAGSALRSPAPAAPAPPQGADAASTPPSPPPSIAAGAATADLDDAAAPVQMPGRYRVRMPEPVLLRYTLTGQPQASAPAAEAQLDWRRDGERYQLEMDGVLGRLTSQGGGGDAGVRPRSAAEDAGGKQLTTAFGVDTVHFGATGTSIGDSVGIQDRASVLMQLAGIGLAEPAQMRGVVDIVVAGTSEAVIAHFEVIGNDTLVTPLGAIETLHLAQQGLPGRARLDVWLAPARGWLPVQLRVTGADGVALTQTVTAITPQAQGALPALPAT